MTLKTNALVEQRLVEFKIMHQSGTSDWFGELCFCILTANSKAETAIKIQEEIGTLGFINLTEQEISQIIKKNKHRFHNNKAKYIVAARGFKNIKELLIGKTGQQAREFIVQNIKGLGLKEASHFLRNVGYDDVAIIDRHILRFMYQQKLITSIPSHITKKFYLECEQILTKFKIQLSRLDLIIWQKMTGRVLK